MDRYPIGSTVNLDLTITASGAGVTAETPTCIVQRLSDGYYHDATQLTGAQFAAGFYENAMTEVDSANLPGLYRFSFVHAEDSTASELFFVRFVNLGGNALTQDSTVAFGPLRTATALSLCNLYGSIVDINGDPDGQKPVRLSILPNTILTTGAKSGISVDRVDTFTDENGDFSVDLIRGLTVRLQMPSIGYDRKIVIPDASSVNFADL